jgi:hypothetical protein
LQNDKLPCDGDDTRIADVETRLGVLSKPARLRNQEFKLEMQKFSLNFADRR